MITVNVDKRNMSIETEGHADYAETGSDIVCAAISALMWALICGYNDACKSESEFRQGYACGRPCPDTVTEALSAEAVFRAILHGLDTIAQKYPKNVVIHWL